MYKAVLKIWSINNFVLLHLWMISLELKLSFNSPVNQSFQEAVSSFPASRSWLESRQSFNNPSARTVLVPCVCFRRFESSTGARRFKVAYETLICSVRRPQCCAIVIKLDCDIVFSGALVITRDRVKIGICEVLVFSFFFGRRGWVVSRYGGTWLISR